MCERKPIVVGIHGCSKHNRVFINNDWISVEKATDFLNKLDSVKGASSSLHEQECDLCLFENQDSYEVIFGVKKTVEKFPQC